MPTNSTQVSFKGRLAVQPDGKVTNNNSFVASTLLAIDDDRKDAAGNWIENTIFLRVEAWSGLGQHMLTLRKGDEVFVQGSLKQSTYQVEGEAKPRTQTKVWANSVSLLRRPAAKPEARTATVDDVPEVPSEDIVPTAPAADVPF